MIINQSINQSIIPDSYFAVLREAAGLVGLFVDKLINKKQGKVVNLSDVAKYSPDRIALDDLDISEYVGVENLLKNKLGKIDSTELPNGSGCTRFFKDDILISNIRPYLRKLWQADTDGGCSGDVLAIRSFSSDIYPRYLYHTLASENFFEHANRFAKGAKMPRGDKKKIMEYAFYLPPLEIQQEIVTILDKFHAITTDLQQGLPKLIEQEQKRYEYYRERLLSFPKTPRS